MNRTLLGFLLLSLGTAFYACGGSTETTGDDKASGDDDDDDDKGDDDDDDDDDKTATKDAGNDSSIKDAGHTRVDANLPGQPIEFKDTCAAVTACDGDVAGTWKLSSGCVDVLNKVINQAKGFCAGLVVNAVQGSIEGDITISGTAVTKNVTVHGYASLQVGTCPGGCASANALVGNQFPGATCKENGPDCDCTVTFTDNGTSNYTSTGAGASRRLKLDDGSEFAACVTGGTKLGLQQTKAPNDGGTTDGLPGAYSATKQ